MVAEDPQGVSTHELVAFLGEGADDAKALAPDPERAPQVAPGKQADHPFAVHYQGPWETPFDGTCVAVRLHARALASTGVPVLLQSFTNTVINEHGYAEPAHGNISSEVLDEVGDLRYTSAATLIPRIKHMVIRDAAHLSTAIVPRYVSQDGFADPKMALQVRQGLYATTIAYTVWERDRVESAIARQLSRCGQVWVPCTQNAEMLMRSGVPEDQVHVVPHPFDPAANICKLTRRKPIADRRFYAIGGWEPRKGFDRLMLAFLLAFKPSDNVKLTIKYTGGKWDNYPSPEQWLKHCLTDEDVVRNGWTMQGLIGRLDMWEGRVSRNEILKLHFDNNIYVSSGHGEAWCLPAFDAKCAGNALVHVPYGGTADFADRDDVRVPFELGPVHSSYHWEPDAQWANYETLALRDALRKAESPAKFGASARFEETFNMRAVGARMLTLALQVAGTVPKAAEYLKGQAT